MRAQDVEAHSAATPARSAATQRADELMRRTDRFVCSIRSLLCGPGGGREVPELVVRMVAAELVALADVGGIQCLVVGPNGIRVDVALKSGADRPRRPLAPNVQALPPADDGRGRTASYLVRLDDIGGLFGRAPDRSPATESPPARSYLRH